MVKKDKLPDDALSGEIPEAQQEWLSPAIFVGMRHIVRAIVCEKRNGDVSIAVSQLLIRANSDGIDQAGI